ncbi:MAG: hypothetical protein JWP96_934 [Polaromonas sp.]|nr:hypothetical protein [Polaromonas sp.]
MKKSLLFFATLGFALAGQAQPTLSQTPAPETSTAYPVASPNRTRSSEMATATRPDKHSHHYFRHYKDDPDALVWVDATGKTVGRFSSENTMVVPFNNQLATLQGLQAVNCENACKYVGGARWGAFFQLYYPTSDCSGQPYSASSTTATPYIGTPIVEGDTTYLYFFRLADMAVVTVNSGFANKQCRAFQQGFAVLAAPSVRVIPASTIGNEPFTVK